MGTELPFIRAIAVCRTDNCPNNGVEIEADYGLPLDSDQLYILCGPCQVVITDIATVGQKFFRA